MKLPKFSAVLVSALLLVSGCDSSSPAPSAKGAGTTAPSTAIASAGPLQPQYAATLAEGIDFARPGYPVFLSEASGLSDVESWGRWTDANLGDSATFRFKQALPATFKLEVTGYAIGPNVDQPIRVIIGGTERIIKFKDAPAQSVSVTFDDVRDANVIKLIAPHSIQPSSVSASKDTRKLGLALVSMKIKR